MSEIPSSLSTEYFFSLSLVPIFFIPTSALLITFLYISYYLNSFSFSSPSSPPFSHPSISLSSLLYLPLSPFSSISLSPFSSPSLSSLLYFPLPLSPSLALSLRFGPALNG
jgi:hypothetical protein